MKNKKISKRLKRLTNNVRDLVTLVHWGFRQINEARDELDAANARATEAGLLLVDLRKLYGASEVLSGEITRILAVLQARQSDNCSPETMVPIV